jgi:hypothetical protein
MRYGVVVDLACFGTTPVGPAEVQLPSGADCVPPTRYAVPVNEGGLVCVGTGLEACTVVPGSSRTIGLAVT